MQPLLADLFPWVVVFYLFEGLAQLGRGHLLLVSGGGAFRALGAGLHLVGLSPLEEVIAVFDLPFLPGAGRAFVLDPRRRTDPPVVEAAELAPVSDLELEPLTREGRKLRAAGSLVAVAPTPEWAEAVRLGLAGAAAGERPDPGRLDLAAARAVRAARRPLVAALRTVGALAFAAVFGLWPLAAYAPRAAPVPAAAAVAIVGGLAALASTLGFGLLRASGEGRRASLGAALHLLFPWAAAHPLVSLSRSAYRRFDALAVAAAFLPPAAFRALAARELARARFSRAATPEELAPAWEARERALVALLEGTGSSRAEAVAPPAAAPGTAAFCPLCRAQYRAGFGRCSDCGVAVVPFGRAT